MTIINAVKFKLAAGMGKIELLTDCIMLVHIPGYLDPHVKLVPIQGAGDGVAKMFKLVYPGERGGQLHKALSREAPLVS